MRKPKRKREWRSLDSAVAAVLVANVLLLAAIVSWPGEPARSGPSQQGPSSVTDDGTAGTSGTDETVGPVGVDGSRVPLLPRNELWQRSQKEAAAGRLQAAISSLQLLLREEPRMGEVPRRAVWLQLSYLAGIAGRDEDAARWLRLSKASLEGGLVPEELLRLAREAASARDWSESRRYAARFLLQKRQLAGDSEAMVAEAYMLLADGYRDQAEVLSSDTGINAPIDASGSSERSDSNEVKR
ncbi:MAG: hypothetical protein H6832_18865 [Planctomycetes bacterium]|nr:hypothetical protein [Planctomycetota bacterium]MCB9920472.1 hypothetical protein [Planctomycetota bacterium]